MGVVPVSPAHIDNIFQMKLWPAEHCRQEPWPQLYRSSIAPPHFAFMVLYRSHLYWPCFSLPYWDHPHGATVYGGVKYTFCTFRASDTCCDVPWLQTILTQGSLLDNIQLFLSWHALKFTASSCWMVSSFSTLHVLTLDCRHLGLMRGCQWLPLGWYWLKMPSLYVQLRVQRRYLRLMAILLPLQPCHFVHLQFHRDGEEHVQIGMFRQLDCPYVLLTNVIQLAQLFTICFPSWWVLVGHLWRVHDG